MRLPAIILAVLVGVAMVVPAWQPAWSQADTTGQVTVRDTPLPGAPAADSGAQGTAEAQAQAGARLLEATRYRANFQLVLTLIVTVSGLLSLFVVLWVFRPAVLDHPERVSRLVIVIVVVSASLLLITGGYSNEQIAPAFGLFGTIIGYILGSAGRTRTPDAPEPGGPEARPAPPPPPPSPPAEPASPAPADRAAAPAGTG